MIDKQYLEEYNKSRHMTSFMTINMSDYDWYIIKILSIIDLNKSDVPITKDNFEKVLINIGINYKLHLLTLAKIPFTSIYLFIYFISL